MLTPEEIARLIRDDWQSEQKKRAVEGQRYYEGKHDILQAKMFYFNSQDELIEDKYRSNAKICHPFFTELSDQLSAYMLSFTENPIRAADGADGLQEYLDTYFDDDFWSEVGDLLTGAYTKGFEYLFAHQSADDRLCFHCADSLGVVEVKKDDTDNRCENIIYWYVDHIERGKKKVRRIQVWDDRQTTFYVQENDGAVEMDKNVKHNPRPHIVFQYDEHKEMMGQAFGYIPFWRLDLNRKRIPGLSAVKALIDDYDLMQCGLSNNLADFDTPLYVVRGYEGDNLDQLQHNLKTKKIIGVDSEGDVQTRVIDIPYQARKAKADEDEKNIYRFGMGFNSSQVGDGNITNIVIRSRYTLLDLKANKLERRLRKLLKEIIRVVLQEINKKHGTDYQLKHIYFDFTKEIPTNKSENIANAKIEAERRQTEVNTILNAALNVGDEQTLKAICDVMEWDFEQIRKQVDQKSEEQDTVNALAEMERMTTGE